MYTKSLLSIAISDGVESIAEVESIAPSVVPVAEPVPAQVVMVPVVET